MLTSDGLVLRTMGTSFLTVQLTGYSRNRHNHTYAEHCYLVGIRWGLLLVGDPAYPLLPYIIKEYATCTTDAEVLFNQMLRDARNAIECAYGRLKERWEILTKPISFKLQDVPSIILACFVLHNWCEQHNVGIDDAAVHQQIQQDSLMQPSRAVERRYTYTSSEGETSETLLKTIFQN